MWFPVISANKKRILIFLAVAILLIGAALKLNHQASGTEFLIVGAGILFIILLLILLRPVRKR